MLRLDIDPYLSPGIADNLFLEKLPKIVMTCGEMDPLRDECSKFLLRLLKLNKEARLIIYKQLSHGYMNYEVPILAVPQVRRVI